LTTARRTPMLPRDEGGRSMSNLEALEKELNDLILAGKGMEAFEKFYADDVSMQENLEAPCVGKDANRTREQQFAGMIEQFHDTVLRAYAIGDGVTFSEWTYEFTMKNGARMLLNEVARRQWANGKVVHERFYYQRA
jgi:hypothetical protein